MAHLGLHATDQAAAKGFPEAVLLAVIATPTQVIASVGPSGPYRCDLHGGEQVRCRAKIAMLTPDPCTGELFYDLWVVLNRCCEKIVTAFYADRPTPIRPDQGIDGYWWTHPDLGYRVWITACTWDDLNTQVADATTKHLARLAQPRTVRPVPPARNNHIPKHTKAYYKRLKKKQQGES